MRKVIAVILCLMTWLTSFSFAIAFKDLSEKNWSYKYVMSLAEKGIINGYTDGTYKPQKHVTRGEFFKLIMTSFAGEKSFDGMKLPSHWASVYAAFAANNGFLMDGTNTDNLNDYITRHEMIIVLSKVCIEAGFSEYITEEIEFSDINNLSESDQLYIKHVVKLGIINGYTDGTFKPNNYMTRAEVATVIYRYLNCR